MPKKKESKHLIEIQKEIEEILQEVELNDGEMTDQQEIALSELEMEQQDKLIGVGCWVKRLDMELAGVKEHKKQVDARIKTLDGLKERLKSWIWKGAQIAGLVTGDEQKGYKGTKFENHMVKVSWRRSKQVIEEEHKREELIKTYPRIYDFELRPVTPEGGAMLVDMIEAGLIEVKNVRFSKSRAEEEFKKMPINGIRIKQKINPQIK